MIHYLTSIAELPVRAAIPPAVQRPLAVRLVSWRDRRMIALYRRGQTLAEIGDHYRITRERVRQILARNGITAADGGYVIQQLLSARDRTTKLKAAMEKKAMRVFLASGMSLEEWEGHVAQWGKSSNPPSPWFLFKRQMYSASRRGIGWEITFKDWWAFWQESGKWGQRGRGHGYAMARFGDNGSYKLGNIYICTGVQNSADSYLVVSAQQRREKMLARWEREGKPPNRNCSTERRQRLEELYRAGTSIHDIVRELGYSSTKSVYNACKAWGIRR